MTSTRCRILAPLAILVLAATPVVAADSEPTKAASAAAASADQSVAVPLDPASSTGSANERPRLAGTDLQRMLRRDSSPMRFTRRTDGVTVFDLNGGFRSVLVLTFDGKGKPEMACVATEEAAEAALSPRAAEVREP